MKDRKKIVNNKTRNVLFHVHRFWSKVGIANIIEEKEGLKVYLLYKYSLN